MQKRNHNDYKVIVPYAVYPPPSNDEISAAAILLGYFKADIMFVPRKNNKTPDFKVDGKLWELKTPRGNGKYNIQHTIKSALKQSRNIVIDLRKHKMNSKRAVREIIHETKHSKSGIERLIVITKRKTVLEII